MLKLLENDWRTQSYIIFDCDRYILSCGRGTGRSDCGKGRTDAGAGAGNY